MLNKDEFILYITRQYNNNDCCTPLEPIIWAVHFNIPKFQRLPLLEHILLRSTAYIKKCYSFLPDKQILGKTYEVLGIPTVCGEPNKCFLNAYKKYKPYYPIRYPKNKKHPLLCNVLHHSTAVKPSTKYININSSSPSVNLKIICSTPNTKKEHRFEVTPVISPIKTQIQEQRYNLPTDSYYDGDCVLNNQNIAKNNIFPNNKQKVTLPRMLELSGFEILNSSQQTLSSEQNGDIQMLNNSNNEQSEIYFIGRDPTKFQYKNYISKSNMSSLSNVSSEESYNRKEKKINNRNITSDYFEDYLKKVEFQGSDFKKPSILFKNKSSTELKQSLSKKLKKNSSLFKKNRLVSESITSPSINIKTSNPKQTKYNTQQSTSESWTRISETINEISFSDFEKKSQTETMSKHNQSKSMLHNEIEQDSSLEDYDKREKNANSWNVESHINNREEDSISSINSSPKVSNELNNYEDHKIYEPSMSYSSLLTFSDTSIISSNSTLNSDKLVSIQHQFISWSQDSSNAIHYEENYIKQNNGTVVFNNTHSEKIKFTSKENISMSFSSENNSSIFSTADNSAYISNFNENSE